MQLPPLYGEPSTANRLGPTRYLSAPLQRIRSCQGTSMSAQPQNPSPTPNVRLTSTNLTPFPLLPPPQPPTSAWPASSSAGSGACLNPKSRSTRRPLSWSVPTIAVRHGRRLQRGAAGCLGAVRSQGAAGPTAPGAAHRANPQGCHGRRCSFYNHQECYSSTPNSAVLQTMANS